MAHQRRSLLCHPHLSASDLEEDDEEGAATVLMTHIRDQLGEDDETPIVSPRRRGAHQGLQDLSEEPEEGLLMEPHEVRTGRLIRPAPIQLGTQLSPSQDGSLVEVEPPRSMPRTIPPSAVLFGMGIGTVMLALVALLGWLL